MACSPGEDDQSTKGASCSCCGPAPNADPPVESVIGDTTAVPANANRDTEPESSSTCASACCAGDNVSVCSSNKVTSADTCCGNDQKATAVAEDDDSCAGGCCASQKAPVTVQASTENGKDSCADSCCASQKAPVKVQASTENGNDSCADGCCGSQKEPAISKKEDSCAGGCCAPPNETAVAKEEDSCADECCAPGNEPAVPKKEDSCADACCASAQEKPKRANSCADKCCDDDGSTSTADSCCDNTKRDKEIGCCEEKNDCCCDVSCLDRLALRDCEESCGVPSLNGDFQSKGNNQSKGKDRTACDRHKKSIRDRYLARLEIIGCLCRDLISRNQDSCCSTKSKQPKSRGSTKKGRNDSCSKKQDKASYGVSTSASRGNGCPGSAKKRGPPAKGKFDSFLVSGNSDVGSDSTSIHANIESGLPESEHAVLGISGMTCTGCETKLNRTLASLDSIRNVKTSLVLSRVEFDLDPRVKSLSDMIQYIERTTEFKCEKITSQGSDIDVIPKGIDAKQFSKLAAPLGISSMEAIDKNVVRIYFDAKVIGARVILEKSFDYKLELAPPRPDPSIAAGKKHLYTVGLMTLLSAILTIPVLIMAWAPLREHEVAYSSASLALATLVQVIVAGPFYPKALKALIFSRMIEMDLLIVLSTSAAYVFSVVSYAHLMVGEPLSTGEFFETSTLLVTLIMLGRFVSALARHKAVESISVRSLQVPEAIIVDDESGTNRTAIDARLLQYGDIFVIEPDSRIPTDGTVVSGTSEVNESMITGESRPVEKNYKSIVIAGSVNGSGRLIARLNRLPQENTISNIANMVDESKLSKPKIQELADKVASYFVPVVVVLTIITLVIWIAIGVAVRGQSGSEAVVQAITYAITVLIVSCPCAIGLAVPMVIVIAGGVGADKGVVIKSSHAIENANKTSHVIFDKTGTLTMGNMTVAHEVFTESNRLENSKERQLAKSSMLLGLVENNKHPVSAAIARHLKSQGIISSPVEDIKVVTGCGVEGHSNGFNIRAGNSRWLELQSDDRVKTLLNQGYTVFCAVVNEDLYAVYGLEDPLRPDALDAVSQLQKRNVNVAIVSGDDEGAVRAIATKLNIAEIRARCTPAEKRDYIKGIMETPGRTTIFCGDGTNDAVALAQATIGVHINEGTDVAQSAADVVLVRPALKGVLFLIDLSKASVTRIAFNFGWSFVYNLFAILLAAGAFVNARIPPEYAGLGELVSVLPVIVIALQLKWARIAKD